MAKNYHNQSALTYVLKALIPYTQANYELAYKPHKFFNELEKISGYSEPTLRTTLWRAQKKGYVKRVNNMPKLTALGKKVTEPFLAEVLEGDVQLMVMFDVPEHDSNKRDQLRYVLKTWGFKMTQKSIWVSRYDYRKPLRKVIRELELGQYVKVYESVELNVK